MLDIAAVGVSRGHRHANFVASEKLFEKFSPEMSNSEKCGQNVSVSKKRK